MTSPATLPKTTRAREADRAVPVSAEKLDWCETQIGSRERGREQVASNHRRVEMRMITISTAANARLATNATRETQRAVDSSATRLQASSRIVAMTVVLPGDLFWLSFELSRTHSNAVHATS